MSNSEIDKLVDDLAEMAINLGLNIQQVRECLDKAVVEDDGKRRSTDYEGKEVNDDDEEKEGDPEDRMVNLNNLTLTEEDVDEFGNIINDNNNNNPPSGNPFDNYFGKTAFGKKIMSKATESVRQIGKKKGIYIVGRKGKKFLGIRFTPKGNYSKNKKGRPNGKMYTLASLRKMKKKRVSFKKLPQLIDMMDTGAVLKKHKDFKFGFELRKNRCSGFGYTFPVGAGYGIRSALLYGKL
tara:strand:- start:104 stop:817 length:714 start_codon:yes stop_codon:yes gene_type:complete